MVVVRIGVRGSEPSGVQALLYPLETDLSWLVPIEGGRLITGKACTQIPRYRRKLTR